MTAPGWTVLNTRGSIRVMVKEDGRSAQSVTLPYPWEERSLAPALARIGEIFKRYVEGDRVLVQAASTAATASNKNKVDWSEVIAEYRETRQNANDKTWESRHKRVIDVAIALLSGHARKPVDGEALCLKALQQWEKGSRQRQIMRQNLRAFLKWAVRRGYLQGAYLPNEHTPEPRRPKKIGYCFSDEQILQIVAAIPDDDSGRRWRFAVQLLAVYGLRPFELNHLEIQQGVEGPEVWTTKGKSMGGLKGDETKPRRLNPLFVCDGTGAALDWDLLDRLRKGESLPPLGAEAGDAVNTYLGRRRRKDHPLMLAWDAAKEDARSRNQKFGSYGFRHRYAKASHSAGFAAADIASSMGHTLAVHHDNYARFMPDNTAKIYAARNAALIATAAAPMASN
jgi:integrase